MPRSNLKKKAYTPCDYCKDSHPQLQGIHLPSDFDDRANCRDGRVYVAKCDACEIYGSDEEAAKRIASITKWKILKSYDSVDSLEDAARLDPAAKSWWRPYFAITIMQADALMFRGEC